MTIIIDNAHPEQNAILKTAVNKLLSRNFFDICIVRQMATLTGYDIPEPADAALQIMHCVKWKDIETEALRFLVALIERICEG